MRSTGLPPVDFPLKVIYVKWCFLYYSAVHVYVHEYRILIGQFQSDTACMCPRVAVCSTCGRIEAEVLTVRRSPWLLDIGYLSSLMCRLFNSVCETYPYLFNMLLTVPGLQAICGDWITEWQSAFRTVRQLIQRSDAVGPMHGVKPQYTATTSGGHRQAYWSYQGMFSSVLYCYTQLV